jgi:hypothetical protein
MRLGPHLGLHAIGSGGQGISWLYGALRAKNGSSLQCGWNRLHGERTIKPCRLARPQCGVQAPPSQIIPVTKGCGQSFSVNLTDVAGPSGTWGVLGTGYVKDVLELPRVDRGHHAAQLRALGTSEGSAISAAASALAASPNSTRTRFGSGPAWVVRRKARFREICNAGCVCCLALPHWVRE